VARYLISLLVEQFYVNEYNIFKVAACYYIYSCIVQPFHNKFHRA